MAVESRLCPACDAPNEIELPAYIAMRGRLTRQVGVCAGCGRILLHVSPDDTLYAATPGKPKKPSVVVHWPPGLEPK